jgi:chromosome segregation ATPase
MAATVKADDTNDTKAIQAGIKDLDGELKQLDKSLGEIKKAQAAILKKPDECRKAYEALYGAIGEAGAIAKDMEKAAKDLNKSIKQ